VTRKSFLASYFMRSSSSVRWKLHFAETIFEWHYLKTSKWIFTLTVVQVDISEWSEKQRSGLS